MPTMQSPPKPTPKSPRDWISEIKQNGPKLSSRLVIHAVEKIGKTSFAASAPGVIFGMTADETGLLTLIDSGQVEETPYLPPWNTWLDVLESIEYLTTHDHPYRVFAIDTLNGVEKLCQAHVCQRDYGGDWGKRGFANYQQGLGVSANEFKQLLVALDRLRAIKKMSIIGLCHTRISTFKNPTGSDYDRYSPAVYRDTWEQIHRWADIIMFANFHTEVVEDGARKKGRGGNQRVFYTVRDAAYDAGNRYGLPEEIEMGSSGKEAWQNFVSAVKGGA